jgi:hypothetical protein
VGSHVLTLLSDESVAKVWVQHFTAIGSPSKRAGCIQKDNQVMRQLRIQTGTHLLSSQGMYVAYIYNNEIKSILHSYNYAILQTLYLELKFFPSTYKFIKIT